MTEQEQIETVLATIERPSYVTDIRFALDNDWSGEPAVWIWVIMQDAIADSEEILVHTDPVEAMVVQALRDAEISRWPYLRFRGQSEQAELDTELAA